MNFLDAIAFWLAKDIAEFLWIAAFVALLLFLHWWSTR